MLHGPYRLIRANSENKLFDRLKAEWASELGGEDAAEEYYSVFMKHAESIVEEFPQDNKYGIYILTSPEGRIDGFVHINHKLPGTSVAEVRLVWTILSPKYQSESIDPMELGKLTSGFIQGAMDLTMSDMPADSMKMLLQNFADRQYAASIAAMLQSLLPKLHVGVRSGWLHIENIKEGYTDA